MMRVAVVGHVEWIEFARVDRVPLAGDIVHALESWEEPGGGGAVAAVGLMKLAGEATLYTALGDDALGRRAHRELVDLGLRVEAVFRPEAQRRAFVHLDGAGERTITVIGSRLGPRAADPLPWAELEQTDAVYFTAGDRRRSAPRGERERLWPPRAASTRWRRRELSWTRSSRAAPMRASASSRVTSNRPLAWWFARRAPPGEVGVSHRSGRLRGGAADRPDRRCVRLRRQLCGRAG